MQAQLQSSGEGVKRFVARRGIYPPSPAQTSCFLASQGGDPPRLGVDWSRFWPLWIVEHAAWLARGPEVVHETQTSRGWRARNLVGDGVGRYVLLGQRARPVWVGERDLGDMPRLRHSLTAPPHCTQTCTNNKGLPPGVWMLNDDTGRSRWRCHGCPPLDLRRS